MANNLTELSADITRLTYNLSKLKEAISRGTLAISIHSQWGTEAIYLLKDTDKQLAQFIEMWVESRLKADIKAIIKEIGK